MVGVLPVLVGGKKGKKEGDRESGEHTRKKISRIGSRILARTPDPYSQSRHRAEPALSDPDTS